MSDEEFWDLTPAQFFALLDRLREQRKAEDQRAGLIASQIFSIFAKKDTEIPTPLDWFGYERAGDVQEDPSNDKEFFEDLKRMVSAAKKKGKVSGKAGKTRRP